MNAVPKEDQHYRILDLERQVRVLTEDRNRAWREYQHRRPALGSHWLIEVGSPPMYYCGPGDWCSNPNHALQFPFAEDASAVAARFGQLSGGHPHATEHVWHGSDSPDPTGDDRAK